MRALRGALSNDAAVPISILRMSDDGVCNLVDARVTKVCSAV